MKISTLLFAGIALVSLAATARPLAQGEIARTYCGVNPLESAFVTSVCLVNVQGYKNLQLVQVNEEGNTHGLVVIRKLESKLGPTEAKVKKIEVLTVTKGNYETRENLTLLESEEVTLAYKWHPEAKVFVPSSISGKVPGGRAFQADLQPELAEETPAGN